MLRFWLTALGLLMALSGCSGSAWRYDPGIPGAVSGLTVTPGDSLVSLSWATPDNSYVATSYNVYYIPASATGVTRADFVKVNVTSSQYVVNGLTNGVGYTFMVTAQNRDGESADSIQLSSTPSGKSQKDLAGTWYFHTLVTGASAHWERGTVQIDAVGNLSFSEFVDSAHFDAASNTASLQPLPSGFVVTMQGDGALVLSGGGAWADFNGVMGSRKNMLLSNWSYAMDGSCAMTIFQLKRPTDDYTVMDVSGTGNQNPYYPELAGNGPTRYAYHALNSGISRQWEYSNARVGEQAQFWFPADSTLFPLGVGSIKDIIYWDYSTPEYKMAPMWDLMWKVTCFGVQPDGTVTEYDNYAQPATRMDGMQNALFTGRMNDDKTIIVGVSTAKAVQSGAVTDQYYLRILEFNFKPTDQALPSYTLGDLQGTYHFQKLGATSDSAGNSQGHWAYGVMRIDPTGVTSFPTYSDSNLATSDPDSFTLAYYPDSGSDAHTWTSFANFVSADTGAADAYSRYYNQSGTPFFSVYTWWDLTSVLTPMSSSYYNEHGTLSYNKDLVVLTRTDSLGYSMIVGLK